MKQLTTLVKLGLALATLGWAFGSWWICCSSHAHHFTHEHQVFREHEVIEEMRGRLAATPNLRSPASNTRAAYPNTSKSENVQRIRLANNDTSGAAHRKSLPSPTVDGVKAADFASATIFISIAAYREQRGPRCIASAFNKAKHPDRIFVGLFQQWDASKDPDGTNFTAFCPSEHSEVSGKGGKGGKQKPHPICSRQHHITKVKIQLWRRRYTPPSLRCIFTISRCNALITLPDVCSHARVHRTRQLEVPWQESEGPCVARARAESLYRGQDFAMQIDAHSTFVQDWDEMLIRMWLATKNEYAVLSGYPRSEGEMGAVDAHSIPMICTAQMLDWFV